jgi:hypothetical protein
MRMGCLPADTLRGYVQGTIWRGFGYAEPMKARGCLVCLVCAACAVLAIPPAGVVAKSGNVVRAGSFELSASLPDHDGFSYSIDASGHHRVELTVSRDATTVTYATKGSAGAHGVHANFGRFGRVDVQIEPEPEESLVLPEPDNCTGKGPTLLPGKFHGSVRFAGEPGVEGVSAHRGRVIVFRDFKSVCKKQRHRHHRNRGKSGNKREGKLDLVALTARSRTGGRTTRFEVVSLSPPSHPALAFSIVLGALSERVGHVEITRSAFELAEEVLKLSRRSAQPRTAIVTPPKPFLGSATFSQTAGSAPTWSGDLGIHLPGAGLVPLAGPEFRARLCRGLSFDAVERCAYGSGSHSQPFAEARLSSLRYLRNSSSSAGSTLYTWSGSGKWRLRTSAP